LFWNVKVCRWSTRTNTKIVKKQDLNEFDFLPLLIILRRKGFTDCWAWKFSVWNKKENKFLILFYNWFWEKISKKIFKIMDLLRLIFSRKKKHYIPKKSTKMVIYLKRINRKCKERSQNCFKFSNWYSMKNHFHEKSWMSKHFLFETVFDLNIFLYSVKREESDKFTFKWNFYSLKYLRKRMNNFISHMMFFETHFSW
jgi:hypothetical protein